MTVDDCYRVMLYAVAKNLQDGYLSPDDFNQTINFAQRSYLDYLLGQYQRYQIQRPIAPVEFGQNERIRQSMAALIYNIVLTVDPITGISPYPSDYEYNDAMWSLYGFYNIKFIQQDRLMGYHRSTIDPIARNPVYLLREEGFWFDPIDIGNARMSYVRTPPPIHWGFTVDGNGIPVYDSAISQDPIWADTDIYQIIVRALSLVGVNLQLPIVMGYANEIKNSGQ